MREHQITVPTDPRVADGYHRAGTLALVLRGVLLAALILTIGGVTLAYRAAADEPRTTYTASATELVVTYGAGADSIDVNVRYPDGSGFNHHPNRAAVVGEVLTLPLTALPAWVQVHTTDCHLGEPGSPGYGTDCRYTEEDPWPTTTATPSSTPTAPPVQPVEDPGESPTSSPDPTPSPSATTGPSQEPSAEPTATTPTSGTPASTDPTPTSPEPDESTTTPTPDPVFDGTNGDPAGWPEDYNQGDDEGNGPDVTEPAVQSEVSAAEDTESPRVLAETGTDPVLVVWLIVGCLILGAFLVAFGRRPRR